MPGPGLGGPHGGSPGPQRRATLRRPLSLDRPLGITIREATTTALLDATFQSRHRVFVEQVGVLSARADRRISDRFDAFPETVNLVASLGDRVVGELRLVEAGAAGIPADDHFDFWPHLPADARVGSASMFHMDQTVAGAPA